MNSGTVILLVSASLPSRDNNDSSDLYVESTDWEELEGGTDISRNPALLMSAGRFRKQDFRKSGAFRPSQEPAAEIQSSDRARLVEKYYRADVAGSSQSWLFSYGLTMDDVKRQIAVREYESILHK